MKYYFSDKNAETCYNKECFINYMKDNDLKEIEVFVAKSIKHDEYFWCKKYELIGEIGSCGKLCKKYNPRNKKSGCCKYYSRLFYEKYERTKIKL